MYGVIRKSFPKYFLKHFPVFYCICKHFVRLQTVGNFTICWIATYIVASMEHYLKKVNLNDSNVIRHLLVFGSVITSLCLRENCSGENNFSQVLFNHLTRDRELKRESQAFRYKLTGTVELPVLRLRGGAGRDHERFLCEIYDNILSSKRNSSR